MSPEKVAEIRALVVELRAAVAECRDAVWPPADDAADDLDALCDVADEAERLRREVSWQEERNLNNTIAAEAERDRLRAEIPPQSQETGEAVISDPDTLRALLEQRTRDFDLCQERMDLILSLLCPDCIAKLPDDLQRSRFGRKP